VIAEATEEQAQMYREITGSGNDSTTSPRASCRGSTVRERVLSFQLPFAVFPLIRMTSDRRRMGRLVNPV
jgi:hypothetical protein